jgi:hypothetical protein
VAGTQTPFSSSAASLNVFPVYLPVGNINQSLMTLRTCIEVLRENQMYGTNKVGSAFAHSCVPSSVQFLPYVLKAFGCLFRWFHIEIQS